MARRWDDVDERPELVAEGRGLVAVVYHATAVGGTDPGWCGYTQLDAVAGELGLPELPPLEELVNDPTLIETWAADCGLGR